MRKLLPYAFILLLLLTPLGAQVSNPSIVSVASAPSGACTSGLPNQQVVSTGTQYSCQSGTWAAIGGGGGSSAFSALTGSTNTTAAMVVGSGASLAPTGTGTIQATSATTVASSETVASSATPTFSTSFNVSYTVLTANVTTFTLAAGSDGQAKTLTFCQNGTGGFTVTPPANVHGFFTVSPTASKCNSQHFNYSTAQTAWLADSAGVIGE